MNIKQAIQSIAEGNSLIAIMAKTSLDEDNIIEFVQYITDQYDEGNGKRMADSFGFEVIDTIIKHGKTINAQAEIQCTNICVMMDGINYN